MKSMSVEIWNGKKQRIGLKLVGKSMSGQNEVINSMTLFYGIYRTEMLRTNYMFKPLISINNIIPIQWHRNFYYLKPKENKENSTLGNQLNMWRRTFLSYKYHKIKNVKPRILDQIIIHTMQNFSKSINFQFHTCNANNFFNKNPEK